jgi:hypothetical protein
MPPVGDNVTHSRDADAAGVPGPWFYQQFGNPTLANIHFLFDHGPLVRPSCAGPTGGCCAAGACEIVTQRDCISNSRTLGRFLGAGTNCDAAGFCDLPPNDSCASPTVITGEGNFAYDNRNATTDGSVPTGCVSSSSRDVWFSWTAPCDGSFTIQTCGLSVADTVLSIHADCVTAPIVCNDDACGTPVILSSLTLSATASTTYLIRIAHFTFNAAGEAGSFSINRTPSPCP